METSNFTTEDLLSPALIAELKRVELTTRRKVSTDLMGKYRTAFRGSGLVFSDLREYQPGDDIKNIHWKASARTGKVYIKSFEEERQLHVMLALDVSTSTNFGAKKTKHRKALEFAALLSLLTSKNQDGLGLCLFSRDVEEFIPVERKRAQFQRVMMSLLKHRSLTPKTDLNPALKHLQGAVRRGSVVFVVSDFLSAPFEEELRLLSLRHDVICVFLEDEIDETLPSAGLVEFMDAETGEEFLFDTSSASAVRELKALHDKRKQEFIALCGRTGSDFIFVNDNPLRPMAELMARRTMRA